MAAGDKKEISFFAIIRKMKWKNIIHVFKNVKVFTGNNSLEMF